MRKAVTLSSVLIQFLTQAQDITGKRTGTLSMQGMELRLIFDIPKRLKL